MRNRVNKNSKNNKNKEAQSSMGRHITAPKSGCRERKVTQRFVERS